MFSGVRAILVIIISVDVRVDKDYYSKIESKLYIYSNNGEIFLDPSLVLILRLCAFRCVHASACGSDEDGGGEVTIDVACCVQGVLVWREKDCHISNL